MKITAIAASLSVMALAACGEPAPQTESSEVATVPAGEATAPASGDTATAMLKTADGKSVGEAKIMATPAGLDLTLDVNGMPPGNHGVHIHTTGQCDAPDFKSAGGHWNPTSKSHGLKSDNGSHMGDFVNLEVAADGTGHLERPIENASLESGPNALLDADRAAFIVHAGPDDQMTDPSGDSGARLACGVFTKTGG